MKIYFLGAAEEVTGSCFYLEGKDCRLLVDCGLVQGKGEELNSAPFPFDPSQIDGVLLTHAHLDHSGRIPLLFQRGFRGKVYATTPTIELCRVLWLDTAKIMGEEAERVNRRRQRSGQEPISPLYDQQTVEKTMDLFEPVAYDELLSLAGTEFVFRNAAHILGAASIELWAEGKKIVFSGDLGQFYNVMEGSPPVIDQADYVVIESTYGNRDHRPLEATREEFASVLQEAMKANGKVLIPSFVVDRAQRILYELLLLYQEKKFDYPVFFDSPMGGLATDIYLKYKYLLSGEIQKINLEGQNPFQVPGLRYLKTPEDSKAVNKMDRGLVIAGSGMCSGGRIMHHLKYALWKPSTHIVFVGFQAQGTLGRQLVEGRKKVRIMGEEITCRAKIHTINGFSAHAGQKDLLRWTDYFKNNPTFFVTHGESTAAHFLADTMRAQGKEALVPQRGSEFDLGEARFLAASLPRKEEDIWQEIEEKITLLKGQTGIEPEAHSLLYSILVLLEEVEKRTGSKIMPPV